MKKTLLFSMGILLSSSLLPAQTGESSAYIMYSPLRESTTYLMDPQGEIYHSWNCGATPASTAYLLEDGSIMRPYRVSSPQMSGGATGGGMQIINWEGQVTWDYTWSDYYHQQHHESIPIKQDDGTYHALIISWERKSYSEAQQAGRQSVVEMWPLEIIELSPVGSNNAEVVWEWHTWDHLCQDVNPSYDNYYSDCSDHPELIDINTGSIRNGDWIHANGIDYDPINDQIVFSSHNMDEVYVIDHSTTTQEASTHNGGNSGKGGDILYRWGHPANYGETEGGDLHVVHCANFIDEGLPGAGNIMMFNNGDRSGSSSDYSSVEEIVPPRNGYTYDLPWNQPIEWKYEDKANFYSNHLSGAFRLKNGNTLATEGTSANIIEVTPAGEIVFEYAVSGFNSQLAKAVGYDPSYPGLIGVSTGKEKVASQLNVSIYPHPLTDQSVLTFDSAEDTEVRVLNLNGKVVRLISANASSITINKDDLSAGVYLLQVTRGDRSFNEKLVVR